MRLRSTPFFMSVVTGTAGDSTFVGQLETCRATVAAGCMPQLQGCRQLVPSRLPLWLLASARASSREILVTARLTHAVPAEQETARTKESTKQPIILGVVGVLFVAAAFLKLDGLPLASVLIAIFTAVLATF